ncbi:hypothetical protein [Halobacillus salinus]|uniref:Uncharacterized protein n=1 Tax=Halobacillus salinus TaxID=192814 RepID=A0A4Z0H490_9BACI|nr:hypothetical protein [Halobacillus salinus]TGB05233.1 hypothetical protein E4663_09660 [Halobacillus salinus]
MMVTVEPCFHWVGYHITTALLQEGVEVIGIDPLSSDLSEHLYLFVGRNSNFQHFYDKQDKEQHVHGEEGEVFLHYYAGEITVEQGDQVLSRISMPCIYGEWMSAPDDSIQSEDDLMQWVMEREATYIGDLLCQSLPPVLSKYFPRDPSGRDEEKVRRNVREVWRTMQKVNAIDLRGF